MTQYTRDKQSRFVELLYKKTLVRGIKWGINSDKQIHAVIAGRSLFVYNGLNDQGEDLVVFALVDGDGKASDIFTDEAIKYSSHIPAGFENWYLLCAAVLEMGRRQASGADDVLDAMIEELDDDVPF